MDKFTPIEAEPLKSVRQIIVDDDHNQTEDTSSPPLPLMVTPLQTILVSTDAGPSSGPIKRGRGRPKGSKNLKTTTKKQKTYASNDRMVLSCPNFDSEITEAERQNGNEEVVNLVLMRFDAVRRRFCQLGDVKGVLTTSNTNCRNLGIITNMKKRIGPVPGVQVGDIFYFWGEMCLVGLHNQTVAGIDYLTVKDGAAESPLATSVVTSGHYNDETKDFENLIYTGHGGKDKNGEACDQILVRGNLALEASKRKGNEVRVIRGEEDPNDKKKIIYIYDGLYLVVDSWKAKGKSGFEEFKFKLVRKPGQPLGYAKWKSAERWRKCDSDHSRKGFLLRDLSCGNESSSPVPLVNEIDENDKTRPEDFKYTTTSESTYLTFVMGYQSMGCSDCREQLCSTQEDPKCICIQRNGGELPYHDRILVSRKPMVYECGEPCPCPLDCKLRLTQAGVKTRVEVFKTEKCGWGLRSLEPIRAGTFICEFIGINKLECEIEEDDEYVFNTSRAYKPFKWSYEPELVGDDCWERVSEFYNIPSAVVISARRCGNVSRFMNHSCSPNVMWQPVESERDGEPCVRIGFFALKHIPPLTELTYDYGMSAEEVSEDGSKLFKGSKVCLCGSIKCCGSFG